MNNSTNLNIRIDKTIKETSEKVFESANVSSVVFGLQKTQCKNMMIGNVMTEYEEKFSKLGNPIHKLVIKR